MSSIPSSTSSGMVSSWCVVGSLPPSLTAVISQKTHRVYAYLSAELPQADSVPASASAAAAAKINTASTNASAHSTTVMRYAVFDDVAAQRRWTVELCCCSGTSAVNTTETWSMESAEPSHESLAGVSAESACRPLNTDARYIMAPDTWKEATLARAPSPLAATPSSPSASPAVPPAAAHRSRELSPVMNGDPREAAAKASEKPTLATATHTGSPINTMATSAVPTTPSASTSVPPQNTAASEPQAAPTNNVIASLDGLSLQELANHHNALVRLLVQALAPQRVTASLVVRKVCAASSGAASGLICEVRGAGPTSSVVARYSAAAVAAAVEQLTIPSPRQPKQRELKNEAYLLMKVDGFADGELRHKAVNRAYPALAHHWPASAGLLDAMERYVDREVVLETRKRHPELMAHERGPAQRKRQRSNSSSASDGSSGTDGDSDREERAVRAEEAATAKASSLGSEQTTASPLEAAPMQRQRLFQSLQECPKSLERGDLHSWCRGAEADKVRECLQVATSLAQQAPSLTSSSTIASASAAAYSGAGPNATTSAVTLSVLPVASDEDVAVLRSQYDALADAEDAVDRHLRDYRDTVHELRKWYREDHCAPQFRSELNMWVRTQEEARTELVSLYERVHVVRYKLERDLSDFLHLRALRVL